MTRTSHVLALVMGLAVLAACRPEGEGEEMDSNRQMDIDAMLAQEGVMPISCRRGGKPRAVAVWVDSAGTEPNNKILIPGSLHKLEVKAGVVPNDDPHLYVLAERQVGATGCQVYAYKLQGGPVNPPVTPEDTLPYTLRIRCKGHGQSRCPATLMVRLEPDLRRHDITYDSVGPDVYASAALPNLSTYALAVPGGPGGGGLPPKDGAGPKDKDTPK